MERTNRKKCGDATGGFISEMNSLALLKANGKSENSGKAATKMALHQAQQTK